MNYNKKLSHKNEKIDSMEYEINSAIQVENQSCLFDILPRDCKLVIFTFLDVKSLFTTTLVCWDWYDLIAHNEYMFKIMCKQSWQVNVPDDKVKNWKMAFRDVYLKDAKVVEKAKDWPDIERAVSTILKESLVRADYIYQKGINKFKCSPLLGNYANFHWNHTQLISLAEKYYQLAIEADPNNVWPICNYATLIWDVHDRFDEAEKYYERALALDSTHFDTLLNFADFLSGVRNLDDRAEQLYLTGLEHHPDSVKLLGHYATFLINKKKDPVAAGRLYQRAAEMHSYNAEALGNYAWFLSSEYSNNHDEAEKYYQKALEINPNYVHAIYNYAMFLQDNRADLKTAKQYYEKALELDGSNAKILRSYSYLLIELNQLDEADKCYQRALVSQPKNTNLLRSYAHYFYVYRRDFETAEKWNLQALKLQPNDPCCLLNYASCLLLQDGKEKQGLEALLKALDNESLKSFSFIRTAAWIILLLHAPNNNLRERALEQVKKCLVWEKTQLPPGYTCNLNYNLEKASRMNHADIAWINHLVQVFFGKEEITLLDNWSKWNEIQLNTASPNTLRKSLYKALSAS